MAEGVLTAQNDSALGLASTGTITNGTQTYTTTTTTVGPGQKEIQSFSISGSAATFTLTFNGQTTPAFAYNVAPSDVQNALNALSSIGGVGGSVTVNSSGNFYTITFGGAFVGFNQPQITATGIGGTIVTVGTLLAGDGAALELQNNLPLYSGGISDGLEVWNDNLILNSPGNATFGDAALAVLGSDMMWRGGTTLSRNSTISVPNGSRLTLYGPIDDATNPSGSGSSLTLIGGGVLQLVGSNTYRGTTFVSQGTLVVANGDALGGTGVSEVQTLTLSGATTGTFTLSFNGNVTGPLSANSPTLASDIETALNALPSVVNASGSITVVGQSATLFSVIFGGNLFGFDQPQLVAVGSGGTVVTPATLIDGGGGTVVADGSALQLVGDFTVAGEPLILQGNGQATDNNVPIQWFPVGPAPANNGATAGNQAVTGRVTGVVVDYTNNNIIYVSTAAGGVWKTLNGGLTWLQLFDLQNGADEVQQLLIGGSTTGSFTLSFDGATTGSIQANSPSLAADIEAQLDGLSTIGGVYGSVVVTQVGNVFTITFDGDLSATNVPDLTFTTSGGTTINYTLIQDGIASDLPMYLGTIAIDPNSPRILYIGTGETNNSNDSYYGTGIYRSVDGGYHWTLVANDEVQAVTVTGTAGNFTLNFNGATTGALDVNAAPGDVQTALDGLSTIGGVGGSVTVTSGVTIYRVTVKGASGDTFTLSFGGADHRQPGCRRRHPGCRYGHGAECPGSASWPSAA